MTDKRSKVDLSGQSGIDFSKLFYETMDKKRHLVSNLYLDTATLVWNGNPYVGKENINKFYETLPVSSTDIRSVDAQPILDEYVQGQTTVLVSVSGWISALNVTDLEGLKDLIITDQVKKRVPQEVRDHFVDVWGTLVKPQDLADKLEWIRKTYRRPSNPNPKAHQQVNVRNNAFSRDNRDYNNSPKQMKQDKGFTRNRYEPKNRPKFTCYFCGVDGHVKKFCPKLLKTNSDQDSRRKANVHRTVVDPEPVTKETAVVAKVMSHRRPSLDKAEKCSLVNIPMGVIVGKDGNMIHQEVLCAVAPTLVDDILLPPEIRDKLQGVQENYFVDISEKNLEPKAIKDREVVDETSDDNPVLGSEEIRAFSVENSEKNAKELSRSDEFLKDQVTSLFDL
ncbi:NTF2-related export protein 1 like protein [Argiope bruennichi]|uniref:NTF2-related export protein 1 like protein n=1 Tax=Argiope bruennichi TaxID=94029 RepID=A0A8T0F367_ARGBR|nr:NTF2-related export protein 1 like protein [Argiope bruennichi]